jgi:hypothetical protein
MPAPAAAPMAVQMRPLRTRRAGSATRNSRISARVMRRWPDASRNVTSSAVADTKAARVRWPFRVLTSILCSAGMRCTVSHSPCRNAHARSKTRTNLIANYCIGNSAGAQFAEVRGTERQCLQHPSCTVSPRRTPVGRRLQAFRRSLWPVADPCHGRVLQLHASPTETSA